MRGGVNHILLFENYFDFTFTSASDARQLQRKEAKGAVNLPLPAPSSSEICLELLLKLFK